MPKPELQLAVLVDLDPVAITVEDDLDATLVIRAMLRLPQGDATSPTRLRA